MAYSVFYFDEVAIDLKEARNWYRNKNKKLETRFTLAIKETILKLQKQPNAYSIRYKNIRIANTPVFPFGIHFYFNDDKKMIVIIAIIHGKRDPEYAKKRSI